MGGYITLRAMLTDPDIKAGVIWGGVVASYPDLLQRWRRSGSAPPTPRPGSWRNRFFDLYGTPDENPTFWDSISANSYVGDLTAPLQLHHSTTDAVVPYEFSVTLNEDILVTGGSVEFYSYPGDDHDISKGFSTAMQRSINFFNEHLGLKE
jgi:dipeptidyl aminopeptidase/acylaminoacyl peptidase